MGAHCVLRLAQPSSVVEGAGWLSYDQRMALIYQTTMSPTKLELLAAWLPTQPWFEGDISALASAGAYRFDDPAGEVGMEGHLLTAGNGTVYHAPLSYRGAPLAGAEAFLLGTSAHGVLGTRYIYDALGDPVYRQVLASTIAEGGSEATEDEALEDGATKPIDIFTHLRGSGAPGSPVPNLGAAQLTTEDGIAYLNTTSASLAVKRVASREGHGPDTAATLMATWPGQETPTVLAVLQS